MCLNIHSDIPVWMFYMFLVISNKVNFVSFISYEEFLENCLNRINKLRCKMRKIVQKAHNRNKNEWW